MDVKTKEVLELILDGYYLTASGKMSLGEIHLRNPHLPITPENVVLEEDREALKLLDKNGIDYEFRVYPRTKTASVYMRNYLYLKRHKKHYEL